MTAGFFAPLPPARTGVADYAAALLRAMQAAGCPVRVGASGDVNLYHLGNNELHAAIYRRAVEEPGVVVLHDALLQHLFLRTLREREYVDEFAYNYGDWHRDLALDLYRRPSGLRPELYRYPMLRRVAETAKAIVVHNRAAAEMVRRHAAGARMHIIPHLYEAPPSVTEHEVLEFRELAGLPPCAHVFGLFGYLRESKRVMPVLRAFRTVHAAMPGTRLLVAGEFVSADLPLASSDLLKQPGVVRMSHLDDRHFWLAASAVEVCLNLRDPSCGETSGVAIRLMGLGKCVVVSNVGENAEFPESACLRVDTGIAEEPMLTELMLATARFPRMASEAGRNAAAHIASVHEPARVAASYWRVLSEVSTSLALSSR